ncbi:acyl-CoA dehydrogenase family protein, partial [Gammaproteobacteria bacterium]|nr:acyl-CoA dehydrogenase family protein [Gammaproteobacteria bacterium]
MHANNSREERGGFSIYVPEYYANEKVPLVICMHGGSGHGRSFLWTWLRTARARNFVLISPTSLDGTWSLMGEDRDSAVLDRLVDYASKNWSIDESRVLLTGMSDGGTFSYVSGLRSNAPASHIIGEPGKGLPRAMRQIGDTRLLFAAQASGYMIWVINYLTEHLKSVDRSGEPRGNKDVVRWHYANTRIKAFAARSMLYRTSRIVDSGENAVNESMATKAFSTETAGEIIDTGIQLV